MAGRDLCVEDQGPADSAELYEKLEMVVSVVEIAVAHHGVEAVVGQTLPEQVVHDRGRVEFDLVNDAEFRGGSVPS
jgi:hypothetical protein